MEDRTIVILDPVSRPKLTRLNLSARPKSLEGLKVAMVDNTKPNFSIFLDRVEQLLLEQYKVGSVTRFVKPGRTVPLAQPVIDDIMQKYDFAITGLGD